jgi:hypothetical protein
MTPGTYEVIKIRKRFFQHRAHRAQRRKEFANIKISAFFLCGLEGQRRN